MAIIKFQLVSKYRKRERERDMSEIYVCIEESNKS